MKTRNVVLGVSLATSISVLSGLILPSQAVQLSDGKVHFVRPPSLVGASTTQNYAYLWGATYYFTLDLPANAGEPLQKVTISQQEGVDFPYFDLRDSRAFEGTRDRRDAPLPLQEVTVDRKARTINVVFNPPVAPGRTITISLYPVRNPDVGGVYLYGITAFPAGEQVQGQFLGYGRIQIYDSFRGGLFRRSLWPW